MTGPLQQFLQASSVLCPECQHDLLGLTTDRCPECGVRLLLRVDADPPKSDRVLTTRSLLWWIVAVSGGHIVIDWLVALKIYSVLGQPVSGFLAFLRQVYGQYEWTEWLWEAWLLLSLVTAGWLLFKPTKRPRTSARLAVAGLILHPMMLWITNLM